uniref:rRNA N-glycosidase n=1 Tax=Oryza glaberrima TaxID=4538 RepID=I1NNR7_ORYGL
MSRLRRAALAAALAGTAAVAAKPSGISVRVSHPPQDGAATTTRGHLGLVRAHPGLQDLNAALAGSSSGRDALFLDAAHALAAGALRAPTFTGRYLREFAKKLAAAESTVVYRVEMGLALVHARDGRFDQALADVARLVADRPGDPHLRITSAALRLLHGRMGTPAEWLNGLPEDAGWRVAFEVVFAMPGSSPLYTQGAADRVVMLLAAKLAEAVLVKNFEQGEWSVADKLAISLLLTALRLFVSKYSRFPYFTRPKSTPPPPSSGCREIKPVNLQPVFLVECSQAMLASLLRARPLCGERLREARATAERALADAEAEGDDLAAVDVNLLLSPSSPPGTGTSTTRCGGTRRPCRKTRRTPGRTSSPRRSAPSTATPRSQRRGGETASSTAALLSLSPSPSLSCQPSSTNWWSRRRSAPGF